MSAESFVQELSSMFFENTFNPYSDYCEKYDVVGAPQKRRKLLKGMLNAASKVEIDSIWIGRDLGYRGGRRTGLALTDDVHLSHHAERWDIKEVERPTKGDVVPERTAAVIWDVLSSISSHIFLWNVFPLHPHGKDDPFSNRTHNSKEREAGEALLEILIKYLEPQKIIAIGNDAEKVALRISKRNNVVKVRHPSYGGQNVFLNQMQSLYDIDKSRQINLPAFKEADTAHS